MGVRRRNKAFFPSIVLIIKYEFGGPNSFKGGGFVMTRLFMN